jgi:uncharacterized protein YegP (UPF0339 family)
MRTLNSLITVLALSFATLSVTACATSGDETADEYADLESNASHPGKLKLWQSTDSQWRFHVVAGNGRTLLTSEGYTSRGGAINGMLSVLENGVDPAMYEVNKTATGYNVHLRAANWEAIAFTQVYSTKSSATRAVTSCVNAITSHLDVLEANTSGARLEVLDSTAGFRFNFHAANGQVVLTSESYTTNVAAYNGAFAVQAAAEILSNFEVRTSEDGRSYFVLQANNGEVVAVSQMYTSRDSAWQGVKAAQSLLKGLELL